MMEVYQKKSIAKMDKIIELQKRNSARQAVQLVNDGDTIAIGTGSTTRLAIEELGRRMRTEKLSIRCLCSSMDSIFYAREAGLYPEKPQGILFADICIDGSDEIDPDFNLLKGNGGAHTLEKILHCLSKKIVIAADSSKRVQRLGDKFSVPIEILPSAVSLVERELIQVAAKKITIREGSGKIGPLVTDHGNLIIDASFEIEDPVFLERSLKLIPGVIESGIFSREILDKEVICLFGTEKE